MRWQNWLVCGLKYKHTILLRQRQNGKENSLKSVKTTLILPNIKTIVYREQQQQQQQLTTLVQVCGSVDDRSQQTQQCNKDAP